MSIADPGITKFFALARERYQILLNRRQGLPKPWSQDPIFQREYFCNVFREDDKTTEWFRKNIREQLRNNSKAVLLAIVAFRWFNRIETWKTILEFVRFKNISLEEFFLNWHSPSIKELLERNGSRPWVTGAYIIKTPNNMDKLSGVLWCIDAFKETMLKRTIFFEKLLAGGLSVETTCNLLKHAPYLGNFMAWQICSDARFTCLLENAHDKDDWAQPGPGSARGLGRVFKNDVLHYDYGKKSHETEMLILMRELVSYSRDEKYWPQDWPKLAVVDISHWLCEVDKYYRAEEGGRMKRKYK